MIKKEQIRLLGEEIDKLEKTAKLLNLATRLLKIGDRLVKEMKDEIRKEGGEKK